MSLGPIWRQRFRESFAGAVRFDEPLRRHTSFRIGGPADVWLEAADLAGLRQAQQLAAAAGLPLVVLGKGTNVLVSDRGLRAVVVRLGRGFQSIEWGANGAQSRVRAGAAVPFRKLVEETARRQLGGLEFAEGIPGSVGGGVLMNAGAFGGDLSAVTAAVAGLAPDGEEISLGREWLHFGYRRLDLPQGFIVTHVTFELHPRPAEVLRARIEAARKRRQSAQPQGHPNAGSIFKNPPGQFAGKLIEEAGLKGTRCGGAQISEQHANFIVNLGGATAGDVKALIDLARERVAAQFGVELELEVHMLGDW